MGQIFPVLFGLMMVMGLTWLVLLKAIFSCLEKHHPEKYEEMGKPSLFWNNSMKTGYTTLKFISKREHKTLGNSFLSRLSDAALVICLLYLSVFIGIVLTRLC